MFCRTEVAPMSFKINNKKISDFGTKQFGTSVKENIVSRITEAQSIRTRHPLTVIIDSHTQSVNSGITEGNFNSIDGWSTGRGSQKSARKLKVTSLI